MRPRPVRLIPPLVLICAIGLPSASEADAGIPMLALLWPLAWIMFLPVVALEAWVAIKTLGLPLARALRLSLWANAVSTVLGIPLTWIVLLLVEMAVLIPLGQVTQWFPPWLAVTVGAPWIAPPEPDGTWQVATAAIWLGLLFAGASIMVERRVAHRVAPELAIEAVDRWCYRANLLSYAAFIGVVLAWWAYQAGRPA